LHAIYLAIASIIAFSTTLISLRSWIDTALRFGFVGKDMNKPDKPEVAEAGGVWVALGASFGLMTLVALHRYIDGSLYNFTELSSLITLLFMVSFIGFLDDILGWKKGLRIWQRVVFSALLSIPLVIIKAGVSTMSLPFIGKVNFGILYPLVLVPIGVMGASNAFNMIAGYNGLEASMGILLMAFTSLYAYYRGITYIGDAAIIMLFALMAFLYYNKYPAKVFPGNSLTYGFGAYYAALVILGDFERYGILLFSLYFVELLLFLRGLRHGVYKENYGKVNPDYSLEPPYERIYSLTHFAILVLKKIRGKATEKSVVLFIVSLQAIIGLIVSLYFILIGPL